jgi:hypothetical protein
MAETKTTTADLSGVAVADRAANVCRRVVATATQALGRQTL